MERVEQLNVSWIRKTSLDNWLECWNQTLPKLNLMFLESSEGFLATFNRGKENHQGDEGNHHGDLIRMLQLRETVDHLYMYCVFIVCSSVLSLYSPWVGVNCLETSFYGY